MAKNSSRRRKKAICSGVSHKKIELKFDISLVLFFGIVLQSYALDWGPNYDVYKLQEMNHNEKVDKLICESLSECKNQYPRHKGYEKGSQLYKRAHR